MNERGYITWKPYSKTRALLDETVAESSRSTPTTGR